MSKILVVDDSKIELTRAEMLLSKYLKDSEILTAEDGFEALEMIREHQPDLVVTDVIMPIMNGLELVVEIREKHPLIPVILMTAAGNEKIASEALTIGAASYVPKKELAVDLIPIINRLIGVAREQHYQQNILRGMTHSSFVLDNDRNLLITFAHEFREWIIKRGLFTENDSFRIMNAMDEALSNAYYHGNLEVSSKLREEDIDQFQQTAEERRQQSPYSERKVFVDISCEDDLIITIRDDGPGFDPQTLPDPLAPGYFERPHGRGLMLMRSFMDDVVFNDKGNQVQLIKKQPTEQGELTHV